MPRPKRKSNLRWVWSKSSQFPANGIVGFTSFEPWWRFWKLIYRVRILQQWSDTENKWIDVPVVEK